MNKTQKKRSPHAQAMEIAGRLKALLSPACERIEIAGSLRRGKPDVGDIELLCIPKPADSVFFADQLDQTLKRLIADRVLDFRLNVNGRWTYGVWNKHLVDVGSGIGVDIFSTTAAKWGMALVVRTGPADFNIGVFSRFRELGMVGHAYGGVTDTDGMEIDCPDEETIFRLLGWPFIAPEERT